MVMEVAHTVIGGKQREATERKRWREIYIERQRDKRGRWREKIHIHRDKNKEKDRKGGSQSKKRRKRSKLNWSRRQTRSWCEG